MGTALSGRGSSIRSPGASAAMRAPTETLVDEKKGATVGGRAERRERMLN
uniref:Uncharacterized protein n=1 Tax=Human herpesvirus 1 TaxID=10298 RepID=A0A2Z4H7Z1_HHV1|nr:hypothetical protein [Human alphaherpesvirus 1]